MANTKSKFGVALGLALLAGSTVLAGCDASPPPVTRTISSEQTTTTMPRPVVSSTTTTTQQTERP